MRPVIRTSFFCILFTAFIVVLVTLTTGCATTAPTGIPWVHPVPDYSVPEKPTVAPDAAGSCTEADALSEGEAAPCTGLLMVPSEVQFLYDTEAQAKPLRDLLHLSIEGRERDRAWADAHYLRVLEERDRARRQRWEAFAVGSAIGFGVCGGIISGVVLQLNAN